ncbi:MAG: hypothetical protein ACU0GG_07555 [Paracoccaceae bacterium]
MGTPVENTLARTGLKVTALVLAKLRRRDIRDEFRHLESLPRGQAWMTVGAVLVGLFVLALIAASAGWIGLAVYFAAVVLIFR